MSLLILSEGKAMRQRHIQRHGAIATEENIESISHDKIQQRNTFSNYSVLNILIGTVSLIIILMLMIMHWYNGDNERPTKQDDDSLENEDLTAAAGNSDKILSTAGAASVAAVMAILSLSLICILLLLCMMIREHPQKKQQFKNFQQHKSVL